MSKKTNNPIMYKTSRKIILIFIGSMMLQTGHAQKSSGGTNGGKMPEPVKIIRACDAIEKRMLSVEWRAKHGKVRYTQNKDYSGEYIYWYDNGETIRNTYELENEKTIYGKLCKIIINSGKSSGECAGTIDQYYISTLGSSLVFEPQKYGFRPGKSFGPCKDESVEDFTYSEFNK